MSSSTSTLLRSSNSAEPRTAGTPSAVPMIAGGAVVPAATQLAYKQKWGPHTVLPEYIAFQGRPRPGAVWRLMRTANAV